MKIDETIFKAYDIRGIYPSQVNEEGFYKIAQAYAKLVNPKTVALGRDVRLSGEKLMDAVKRGLIDHGVNVVDIGVITTDMFYFASAAYDFDGALTITASHNPREYNGMKLVRKGAVPISVDTGINEIAEMVNSDYQYISPVPGKFETKDILNDYLKKCLNFVDVSKIDHFKVVANAMFGKSVQNLMKLELPIDIVPLNEIPDGTFPKGAPDPFLAENRAETEQKIREVKADIGVAWDGDADRIFIWDENGRFIPGYFLTAFLANYFCKNNPGAKIIHDPRDSWAIIDTVKTAGGIPLLNKVGHSFIKERMRKEDALFAGESSGHYYFRDYYYADNGLIPFLLFLQLKSELKQKVSEIFDPYFNKYFISGEINIELPSKELAEPILRSIENSYLDAKKDYTDGVSIEYSDWRANIRTSNTQPLIRLNVEAKSDELMKQKTAEILKLIK